MFWVNYLIVNFQPDESIQQKKNKFGFVAQLNATNAVQLNTQLTDYLSTKRLRGLEQFETSEST